MKTIDDFYSDAMGLRQAALAHGFADVDFHGQTYHGISFLKAPADLYAALEATWGASIQPAVEHFCLSGRGHVLESGAYIHADSIFAPRVALLYLTASEHVAPGSGTALWRHKATGWESMPDLAQIEAHFGDKRMFFDEWKQPDRWEQTHLIEQRFNRLAIYDAARFHSRWPFQSEGTTDADSRLIWTCWFNKGGNSLCA